MNDNTVVVHLTFMQRSFKLERLGLSLSPSFDVYLFSLGSVERYHDDQVTVGEKGEGESDDKLTTSAVGFRCWV